MNDTSFSKTIWFQPRRTVGQLLERNDERLPWFLIIAASVVSGLVTPIFSSDEMNVSIVGVLLGSLTIGVLIGIIGWWITSGLYYLVGNKMLGGIGTYKETRAATAYSTIPVTMTGAVVYVLSLVILRGNLYTDPAFLNAGASIWTGLAALLFGIASIWSFVTLVNAIRVVHHVSGWRAFWTVVLPTILFYGFLFFLFFLLLIPLIFFFGIMG